MVTTETPKKCELCNETTDKEHLRSAINKLSPCETIIFIVETLKASGHDDTEARVMAAGVINKLDVVL